MKKEESKTLIKAISYIALSIILLLLRENASSFVSILGLLGAILLLGFAFIQIMTYIRTRNHKYVKNQK